MMEPLSLSFPRSDCARPMEIRDCPWPVRVSGERCTHCERFDGQLLRSSVTLRLGHQCGLSRASAHHTVFPLREQRDADHVAPIDRPDSREYSNLVLRGGFADSTYRAL